jgi:hypothetical protein
MRGGGPMPWGAQVSSSALAQPREVPPQRGMAFAHHHSVGLPGSMVAIMALPAAP